MPKAPAGRLSAALALALASAAPLPGCPSPSAERSAPPSASAPASPSLPEPSAHAAPPTAASEAAPPRPPASAPAGLPPPAALAVTACCMTGRAEGIFGPEKGINARYSGDFLRRKDGERLLFPDDLISDTKELYQFARSVDKSLYQERRLRALGEGQNFVSVEIEDRGETGASMPFFHSKCKTVDLRHGRALALADLLGKEEASRLLDEARQSFERAPEHESYRFVPTSFAVLGPREARLLRLCNPRREERLGSARLDLEIPLGKELR